MNTPTMHRSTTIISILVLIFGLTSCVTSRPEQQSTETVPPTRTTPTIRPTASPSPFPTATRQPTKTSTPESVQPSAIPAYPKQICPQEELDAYLAQVDPIASLQLQDSKQAEHIEHLTQSQKESFRQAAIDRDAAYRKIIPPECLQEAHAKMIEAASLLIQAWDLGLQNDVAGSNQVLKSSYYAYVDAIVIMTGYGPDKTN